jgi:hypothetical protein
VSPFDCTELSYDGIMALFVKDTALDLGVTCVSVRFLYGWGVECDFKNLVAFQPSCPQRYFCDVNRQRGNKLSPRDFIRYLHSGYTDFDAVRCILRINLRLSHRKWNLFPYINKAAKPEAPSISRCFND